MTGKLIKYEIRSSMKLIAVIWAALIAASLLFSLSGNLLGDTVGQISQGADKIVGVISFATGFMYFAVFMALVAVTVIIVIMRFYKGLLCDEGYLMHTLPVKPWQLITAKGIVAALVVLASIVVALLSLMIVGGISSLSIIPDLFGSIAEAWKEDPGYVLIMAEMLIIVVLSLLKSIYQIYASLAIGQLAGKYRLVLSLGAYIGISIIITVLFVIGVTIVGSTGLPYWMTTMNGGVEQMFSLSQIAIAIIFGLTAIQLIAFHIITERILTLKLNLQ